MDAAKPRLPHEPFATLSLILSLAIMVFPIEADLLTSALTLHHPSIASLIAAASFAIVFTPFCLSWRRLGRNPTRWRGRIALAITGLILALNLCMIAVMFWIHLGDFPIDG